jgi:hypothetical protein
MKDEIFKNMIEVRTGKAPDEETLKCLTQIAEWGKEYGQETMIGLLTAYLGRQGRLKDFVTRTELILRVMGPMIKMADKVVGSVMDQLNKPLQEVREKQKEQAKKN